MTNNYFTDLKRKRETKRLELRKKKLLIAKESSESIRAMMKGNNKPSQLKYHLEPKYHGYDGGYDLVTKCQTCSMIGLYEDQHPVKPCHFCGGKVETEGAGRWEMINNEYQWNLRKKINNGEE